MGRPNHITNEAAAPENCERVSEYINDLNDNNAVQCQRALMLFIDKLVAV